MSGDTPNVKDEFLISELRQLDIAIQKNPAQSKRIVADWYEKTLNESGPKKAEMGMLLRNILNEVEGHVREALVGRGPLLVGSEKPVVISLHGIRTRGDWQQRLSSSLSRNGFAYEPLDYGFFRAIQLVLPFVRDAKTRWFLDKYTAITKGYQNPPSVIAHSFGTYLVARTLDKYVEVKFDRIIFCGSIVEVSYPWSTIIGGNRAKRVLNDYGGKDFWAKTAVWFVNDAGPSGAKGFQDDAGGQVVTRYRPKFRHSDFFYEANFEKTWIPFLGGKDPDRVLTAERRPANWKFRIVACFLTLLAAALLIAGFRYIRTRQTTHVTAEVPPGTYQNFHREYANASPSKLVCTGKRIPKGVTVQVSLAGSWSEVPPETIGDWIGPCGKPPGGGDCSGHWKPYLVVRAFDVPYEELARQLYQHPNTLSASKDYDVCVQLPLPNAGHGFAINPNNPLEFTVVDSRAVSQISK